MVSGESHKGQDICVHMHTVHHLFPYLIVHPLDIQESFSGKEDAISIRACNMGLIFPRNGAVGHAQCR